MKHIYEVQRYYSGWYNDSFFSNKIKALTKIKNMSGCGQSVRVVRHAVNAPKRKSVTVYETFKPVRKTS